MSWNLYCLQMKLKSPLHIGTFKVSNFDPTRLYVPGKVMWGALTATITRYLGSYDYLGVGNFLNTFLKFGYYFPSLIKDNGSEEIFYPKYTLEGLKYGKLSEAKFRSRFISSQASTAIDSYSQTSEDEMLHEMEFINSHTIVPDDEVSNQVFLKGLLWIKEGQSQGYKVEVKDNYIHFISDGADINIHTDLKNLLQIGGERKYGFGIIDLEKLDKNYSSFQINWEEKNGQIFLSLEKNSYVWAHVEYHKGLKIKGDIEPLVSKVWGQNGAGLKTEHQNYHWVPGSKIFKKTFFKVWNDGLWKPL
ncbi:MAG: RAMP superfamily CRISPR-associated protein [Promethearchaeota archaeon]